jgi:CRISPR type III-A-associated RAMP protein Csm5
MNYSTYLRSEIPHRDIEECIKTNFEAYIPGSSIKGAIRTAIFYNMVGPQEIRRIDKIFDERKYWKRNRNLTRLFTTMISGKTRSPHSDLLKFLQITDSHTTQDIAVHTVKTLDIYRNKWSWLRRGKWDLVTYLEVIPTGGHLPFDFKINKDEAVLEELGLQTKGRILDEQGIKKEVYAFSKDIIDYELDFASKYGIDFLYDFYRDLQSENNEIKPLLKLGQGSGFLNTTICLKLKKDDPRVYEKVRRALRGRSHSFEFPKTRKIILEEKVPLGWCKIS